MSMLAPLGWASFLSTWRLEPGWLVACLLLAGGYLLAWRVGRARSTVHPWRVGSFVLGAVVLWVCVASGIGAYSMDVFWMHMVLHLLLIMAVPILLVLGHPITVALEALDARDQERGLRARRVVTGRAVGLLTHPLTGLAVYTVVIIGTHLTGFMDQMAMHSWLMTGEQIVYVIAGVMLYLPLLGEEPIRSSTPYLLRLMLLLVAMVPDTVVGIVLLQSDRDPFPMMMGMHPAWAPDALSDLQIAGGLMWAGGDGLMMLAAIGLMLTVVTTPAKREQMTGRWLESVRGNHLAAEAGDVEPGLDPDSDEAYEAYNRMLQRRSGSHPQS